MNMDLKLLIYLPNPKYSLIYETKNFLWEILYKKKPVYFCIELSIYLIDKIRIVMSAVTWSITQWKINVGILGRYTSDLLKNCNCSSEAHFSGLTSCGKTRS